MTSTFSISALQQVNAAFNSNKNYDAITYNNVTLPLVSFLGNPNYSGFNIPEQELQNIYNAFISNMNTFINDVSLNNLPNYNLGNIKLRIVVTIADGNVFFDSSKGENNTYTNFLNKSINENHGTRHYIQQAFHSKNGIGWETKWSSSTQALETYYAVRLGMSEFGIIGVITFSYSDRF